MNFPILPFCRSNIPEFEFKIQNNFENYENLSIIKINNYKAKIEHNFENCDIILFGKYKNIYWGICEVDEINEEFHHIMGRHFPEDIRAIIGIGVSILKWHKETKYCGKCGKILEFSNKELNAKYCENCKLFYYPRINPAIIISVKYNNSILVARKAEWKAGRYGLIAGFIEYGENIEEAAIREVYEETQIEIKNIKYIASQFWPFPYQLMIGLEAEYHKGEIIPDKNELAEAKWLKFSEIREEILPPPTSIARFLMERYLK